jgi:FkbM family methyltransferase
MLKSFKNQIDAWMFAKKGARFCDYFNVLNRFYWKYPVTLSWDDRHQKILVSDGREQVFIARPRRARRYKDGIVAKLDGLTCEYMLGRISFHDDDCVFDCGANVGEVGMCLKRINDSVNIISIEPEEDEATCCDLNVYAGERQTIRKALWSEEGELTLFSKNQTGDSSLFETENYESSTKIPTTTLSALIEERDIAKVRLLKLEAEGAEPEILAGAERYLQRIEYISADLGPERGIDQESTAAAAINFLLSRNFRLIDINCDRLTYLFKNTAFD